MKSQNSLVIARPVAYIGDEIAPRAPAPKPEGTALSVGSPDFAATGFAREETMSQHRRRRKQTDLLEERLLKEAQRLREEARKLPPSPERLELVRRARQVETSAHLSDWLRSPGLRPPT